MAKHAVTYHPIQWQVLSSQYNTKKTQTVYSLTYSVDKERSLSSYFKYFGGGEHNKSRNR